MMYILILTLAVESSHLISSLLIPFVFITALSLNVCFIFPLVDSSHFLIIYFIFPLVDSLSILFFRFIYFLGVKTTANHLPYHFVMIYILPAIFTAAVASSGIEFGYLDTSSAICSISSKDYKDVYFFYIPILVFSLVGLIAGKIKLTLFKILKIYLPIFR